MIPELQGKTIGLVGFGYIGQLVAQKLSGFKVNILVSDPYVSKEVIQEYKVKKVTTENLLKNADFVSLTDNSMADTLHRHSELSASDGTPDRALVVDAAGNVGIGTTSPTATLDVNGSLGFTQQSTTGDGTTTIDWTLGNKFKLHFLVLKLRLLLLLHQINLVILF